MKLIEGKAEIVQQQNLLSVFVCFSLAEFAVLGDKLLNLYGFLLSIYSLRVFDEFALLGDNLLNLNNCHATKHSFVIVYCHDNNQMMCYTIDQQSWKTEVVSRLLRPLIYNDTN